MLISNMELRAIMNALIKENMKYNKMSDDDLEKTLLFQIKKFNLEDNKLRTRLVHKNVPNVKLVPKSNDKSTSDFKDYFQGSGNIKDFVRSIDLTKIGKLTNIQRPKQKIIAILNYIDASYLEAARDMDATDITTKSAKQKETEQQKPESTGQNLGVEDKSQAKETKEETREETKEETKEKITKEPGPPIDARGLTVKQAIHAYLNVKDQSGNYPDKWTKETETAWDNFIETDFVNYFKFLNQTHTSSTEGYEGSNVQKQIKSLIDAGYKDFQREFNGAIDKYKDASGFTDKGPKGALIVLATIHHYPDGLPDNVYDLVYSNPTNVQSAGTLKKYARTSGLPEKIVYAILQVESNNNPEATAFNADNFLRYVSLSNKKPQEKVEIFDKFKTFVSQNSPSTGVGGTMNSDGSWTQQGDVAFGNSHSNDLSKKVSDKAYELHPAAAFGATAFGKFQIMGFHKINSNFNKSQQEINSLLKEFTSDPDSVSENMFFEYIKGFPDVVRRYNKAAQSDDLEDYKAAAEIYYGKPDEAYATKIRNAANSYPV